MEKQTDKQTWSVGTTRLVMTAQEEQQVAQQIVEVYKQSLDDRLYDTDEEPQANWLVNSLDLLAMAKHLQNIAKFAADMLTNDALREVNSMIEHHIVDDNNEPVQANKQFTKHGNKWLYQLKETYDQLGNQRLSDGNYDPNSVTYHSLEVQQEQMKRDSKALTAQMTGLKARILNDHPLLRPTEIVVSLALKGQA